MDDPALRWTGAPIERWVTRTSYPAACCATEKDADGNHFRCGAATQFIQHVGGNDMQIALCEKHLFAKGVVYQ